MHEVPYFFEPFILNIHTKYDITVLEQRQLVFNYYGMRDPESGNDGKKENDGMLALRKSLLNIRRLVHVSATTVECIPNDSYSIQFMIMIVACCIRIASHKYLSCRPM
jgi:hypothetical protein